MRLKFEVWADDEKNGFDFTLKKIFNHTYKTEWFKVYTDSELYKLIEEQGLLIFNSCKYRKSVKWYNR